MSANPRKIFDPYYMEIIKSRILNFINNNLKELNIDGFTAPIIFKHLNTYTELLLH